MIEEDMSDWDRHPNGDIETAPVAGWAIGTAPHLVLLRLEILQEDGRIGTAQVHFPADRIDEFAKALRLKARRARSGRPA